MSLNWKEINLILEELSLPGMQIQKAVQSAFDVISLKLYGKEGAKTLLICLSPGACRLHETFSSVPKNPKPLRFAEFLNSRIVNGRIEEAFQIGNDRIIRLTVRSTSHDAEENHFRTFIYIRLWSNAANVIVTDTEGKILDAMRRIPKRGEVSGGHYTGEEKKSHRGEGNEPIGGGKEYFVRDFSAQMLTGLPPDASFNQKIDAYYRSEGGSLSLDALREEARKKFERSIDRIKTSLEKLKEKEADFKKAERFKELGDEILANLGPDQTKDKLLEAKNYYEQYKKAKSGLKEIQSQIKESEEELKRLKEAFKTLLSETNPLVLNKLLKTGGKKSTPAGNRGQKYPGLCFRRRDWLIIVGRDAAENDTLLRKFVKGNDLWLHARDFPGSYVFIKHSSGKTVPLDILLDAGNLAIFYSKGRNNGEGDLFYTPVKYLRRAKGGPRGTVIPTQEKNLHVRVEPERLRELEKCRV